MEMGDTQILCTSVESMVVWTAAKHAISLILNQPPLISYHTQIFADGQVVKVCRGGGCELLITRGNIHNRSHDPKSTCSPNLFKQCVCAGLRVLSHRPLSRSTWLQTCYRTCLPNKSCKE